MGGVGHEEVKRSEKKTEGVREGKMEEKETGIEEESMRQVKREGSKGKDRKGKRREARRGERMNKKSSTFVHKILVPCRVCNASTEWQFLLTLTVECAMYLLNGSSYSL